MRPMARKKKKKDKKKPDDAAAGVSEVPEAPSATGTVQPDIDDAMVAEFESGAAYRPTQPATGEMAGATGATGQQAQVPSGAQPDAVVVTAPSFSQATDEQGVKINPLTMKPAATAVSVEALQQQQQAQQPQVTPEQAPEPAPEQEAPVLVTGEPTGTLGGDLGVFFQELSSSLAERYDLWESSINTILTTLRMMQQVTNTNAEIMISSIEKMHDEIKVGLNHFVTIRTEIEKYTDQNLNEVVKNLNRVLGILSLQIKEYQLKNKVNAYVRTVALGEG
ncbi:MAG: hypothetical protein ACTSU5_17200 [Promethearchaeota archaeon]